MNKLKLALTILAFMFICLGTLIIVSLGEQDYYNVMIEVKYQHDNKIDTIALDGVAEIRLSEGDLYEADGLNPVTICSGVRSFKYIKKTEVE